MNIYTSVKASVKVSQAAEYYGVKMRSNHMMCCIFHNDHSPSMKLNEDYYYCFGCGAHGDVIDFIARLFGLSSYEAAQKLKYDFDIGPDKPPVVSALQKPMQHPAKSNRHENALCQRAVLEYLRVLQAWKEQYAPKDPNGMIDDRFAEACRMLNCIEYIADLITFSDPEVSASMIETLRNDGTADRLIKRLKNIRREVIDHDEPEIA